MPFTSRRASLVLSDEVRARLEGISRSRSESAQHVERARILLGYAGGQTVSAIARALSTNRPKVERCVDKGLQLGVLAALGDLPRKGRPGTISSEARAWVVSLACVKPKALGYPEELWTTRLLASHVRAHCEQAGHPSLAKLARGTVSKILAGHRLRPHKIEYYLEKRDPEFDTKMAQVLVVYKLVELARQRKDAPKGPLTVFVSYDEKPGIQAIGGVAPDLPPKPGKHVGTGRDYEYQRHGTLTLMAGLDLMTGHIHRAVVERHRSREFVAFLRQLDRAYPAGARIRLVLDNHSAHVSKETRGLLGDDGEPIRVRLHTQARLLAERGRIVLREAGQHAVARDAGGVQGGAAATHRTLHRPAERRPGGIQVDVQDGRDLSRVNVDMLCRNRPTRQ